MSLIRKILNIWAESGDKEAGISDEKHALGWVGDDRPNTDRFNYLQNRVEEQLNSLAVEGISSAYDEATRAELQLMLTTGLWGQSWGVTNDTANTISGGSAKAYGQIGASFDSDGNPQLLVLDAATNKIEVWDARAKTLTDTSHDLSTDIIAGTWTADSFATDGTWIYVTFQSSANAHHVHAWLISDWSVHTGWAATGTVLPGTGTLTGYGEERRIIVASATRLATMNPWNTVTASSSAAISIINIATGAITASGAGDAPTGDSVHSSGGICSDGTYVFYAAFGSAGANHYLCSSTIATPSSGCGGSNYPETVGGTLAISTMVQCGPQMYVSIRYDTGTPSVSDTVLKTHTAGDARGDFLRLGQNTVPTTPTDASEYVLYRAHSSTFDGVNLWIWGIVDNLLSTKNGVVLKIDVGKFVQSDANTVRQLSDLADVFFLPPDTAVTEVINGGQVTFDGRDIWVNPEYRASQTLSGKIYRLPLALLRS